MQVDRLRVHGRERAGEIHLANYFRLALGRVHDDEVVGSHPAQADRVGGIRLVGPMPRRAAAMQEPGFLERFGRFVDFDRAEPLARVER